MQISYADPEKGRNPDSPAPWKITSDYSCPYKYWYGPHHPHPLEKITFVGKRNLRFKILIIFISFLEENIYSPRGWRQQVSGYQIVRAKGTLSWATEGGAKDTHQAPTHRLKTQVSFDVKYEARPNNMQLKREHS